ncbi:pentapeptide repeat-containing protein [Streptomyces luteolus]|uniref:Pentapeptide repeat-containing protein n=1 Tax=Streptomyces luteolus TaxID=3043615 RepID=A0ABT6SXQ8_9ACTN|nr:pentapeptide repeat-containing protein [Streptomyces sp. B-S-A12]MDI3420397.1 pentapeptide repeat-containing protein [Streptomyces sp. B-S-A12]
MAGPDPFAETEHRTMDSRTIGRITLNLPDLSGPGLYLSNVQSLEGGRGVLQDFHYTGAELRSLDLADAQLVTGRISGLRAGRVQMEQLRLHSVEFDSCDLGSATWSESKLSRVAFRQCKLMGATLSDLTLDHVLFDGCRLDYATLEAVRATGPVAFSNCILTEVSLTGCDLTDAVLDSCTLRLTEFGKGRYKGLDLRGNDLSSVRGVAHLAKVVIDHSQQADLAQALITDLDVTYGEDLDHPR